MVSRERTILAVIVCQSFERVQKSARVNKIEFVVLSTNAHPEFPNRPDLFFTCMEVSWTISKCQCSDRASSCLCRTEVEAFKFLLSLLGLPGLSPTTCHDVSVG
jgi:hypothetical protein